LTVWADAPDLMTEKSFSAENFLLPVCLLDIHFGKFTAAWNTYIMTYNAYVFNATTTLEAKRRNRVEAKRRNRVFLENARF